MSSNIKTIIIVDDSKTSQMITKSCMEICGFDSATFLFASDGQKGLDMINSNPVDLVILDLNMPIMTGMELLKRLKASIKTIYIPVIILSSIVNDKKEKELLDVGAAYILKKPVSPALFEPISDKF
jgi:putative two-component system response regulator